MRGGRILEDFKWWGSGLSTLVFAQLVPSGPLVDPKTGQPTFAFTKWLQNLQQALNNAFTTEGNISPDSIPFPTASALGGILAVSQVTHQWIAAIGTNGAPLLVQPSFGDIAGKATPSQVPPLSQLQGSVTPAQVPSLTAAQVPNLEALNGAVTPSQVPALSALTGAITDSQLPPDGISGVVATAKLTTGGADGSMTFTNGILTSYTAAT